MGKEITKKAVYYDEVGNVLNVLSTSKAYAPSGSGDQATPVVAAVAGKKIRVLSWACSTSINGPTIFLRSGAGGTQISETVLRSISGAQYAVNYQRSAYYPIYLFETAAGQALVLNCSASGTCSVQVVYVLV